MLKEYEGKTAFHLEKGTLCYTKIPFKLRNTEDTYQRMIDKVFEKQIGWKMEVYVDDMVMKSSGDKELLKDIKETMVGFRKQA